MSTHWGDNGNGAWLMSDRETEEKTWTRLGGEMDKKTNEERLWF